MVNLSSENPKGRLTPRQSVSFRVKSISDNSSREINHIFGEGDFEKLISQGSYYDALVLCHDVLRELETQVLLSNDKKFEKSKKVVKSTREFKIPNEANKKLQLWKRKLETVVVAILDHLIHNKNLNGAMSFCSALLEAEAARVNLKMISKGLNPKLSVKEPDANTVFTPFSLYVRSKQIEIQSLIDENKNSIN
ncbi:MAG: hypothetical protein V3575_06170 [Candidatus Absconditabacteria bacterium]